MSKRFFLAFVLASGCADHAIDDASDEPEELTIELSENHFIRFAADQDGYETVLETSPRDVLPILDQYGAASAASLYEALVPATAAPSFLRSEPENTSLNRDVDAVQQPLTADEFINAGGCSADECLRQTDPAFVVLSEACLLDQPGAAQASGLATKAYARFNAQSTPAVAILTLPGGKVQTAIVQPGGHLRARASGPRNRLGQIGFEIQGENGSNYDLYACFTAREAIPADPTIAP